MPVKVKVIMRHGDDDDGRPISQISVDGCKKETTTVHVRMKDGKKTIAKLRLRVLIGISAIPEILAAMTRCVFAFKTRATLRATQLQMSRW